MLGNYVIVRLCTTLILPYMVLYALVVQLNGEVSPGGGFQAGVILASAVIAFDLVFGYKATDGIVSRRLLELGAALGVFIYAATGAVSLFSDASYLNYSQLGFEHINTQALGIGLIEIGVGLTVASIMILIYLAFENLHKN